MSIEKPDGMPKSLFEFLVSADGRSDEIWRYLDRNESAVDDMVEVLCEASKPSIADFLLTDEGQILSSVKIGLACLRDDEIAAISIDLRVGRFPDSAHCYYESIEKLGWIKHGKVSEVINQAVVLLISKELSKRLKAFAGTDDLWSVCK